MNLDWRRLTIPHDKALHLIFGFLVALLVASLVRWGGYPQLAGAFGAAAAFLVGALKELSDFLDNCTAADMDAPPPHSVTLGDVAATFGGGLALWAALALAGVRL